MLSFELQSSGLLHRLQKATRVPYQWFARHNPTNNFNLSFLSVTKVEITQARRDSTAVHGNAIKQSVCRKGCVPLLVRCAFRLFSNDNKMAMKILLSNKSERCYYSFHSNVLFQMNYLVQCGQWFVANCHVFL